MIIGMQLIMNTQIIRNIPHFAWNKRSDRFIYRRNVIYSYRVEQAMAINLSPNFDMKNDIIIQRKMICAILIHRKAMKLVFILYMYVMKKERYQEVINIKVIVFSTMETKYPINIELLWFLIRNGIKQNDCCRKYPKNSVQECIIHKSSIEVQSNILNFGVINTNINIILI
jgi:hypothetical protein